MSTATCERCGRTAELLGNGLPPEGWEGTVHAAVCPGCQYAEWHPHCTSLVMAISPDGSVYPEQRVDPAVDGAAIPREEWDFSALRRCEYIDESISVTDADADWPHEWRCPQCGGTSFEWVHRDHQPSGLHPGMFRAELREPDDNDGERDG